MLIMSRRGTYLFQGFGVLGFKIHAERQKMAATGHLMKSYMSTLSLNRLTTRLSQYHSETFQAKTDAFAHLSKTPKVIFYWYGLSLFVRL